MRRLVALGAALLILLTLGGTVAGAMSSAAMAQGLADVRLGNEAFREGDFAAAVEHYTSAIRSGELVGEALAITYNNRGVAHGEAGDFGPAIADYSQALALRPDDTTTIRNLRVAHVRRGEVSFASGAYDAAVEDFNRAIELEPDHYLAYQRRGELYAERGLIDDAVADLEQAAMLNPGDPEIVAALDAVSERQTSVAGGSPTPTGMPAETPTGTPAAVAPEAATAPSTPAPTVAAEAPAEPTTLEPAAEPEPEPEIAARPEPAPREAAPAPSEPQPSAAPPASAAAEPSQPDAAGESAAAAASAGASASAEEAGEGEPYRVISAVNYRAGPDNDAQRLGSVDAGRIVRVTGDTLGWKHVTLPNGDRGFIYERWLEPAGN